MWVFNSSQAVSHLFWTTRTETFVQLCQFTPDEKSPCKTNWNYIFVRYAIDFNHIYLIFHAIAWWQIWLSVIRIKLFHFADVWINNIYSFPGRHIKSLISSPLQGSMLYAAWEMVFVVSLDQLQTVDENKLRREMWFYFALSLHFPTQMTNDTASWWFLWEV